MRLHFLDWPLRLKMAALLAVASLLPLAVAATIDIRDARQRLIDSTSALLAARGDQLVGELDTFQRAYQRTAAKFARLPSVVEFCRAPEAEAARLAPRARAALLVQPTADPSIRGAALLDTAGTVIIATEDALVGKNLAFHAYVREALRGKAVISDLYLAEKEVGRAPTIAYVAPVEGRDGTPSAYFALWVKADAFWAMARASNGLAGPRSFAVMFDQAGIRIGHTYSQAIVFHPGGPLASEFIGAAVAEQRFGDNTEELLRAVRSFPEQFDRARAAKIDGSLFRGFAPVNGTWNYGVGRRLTVVPWTVFYMIPEASLNAQIAELTRRKVLFAGAIILIALVAGALVAAIILRPVAALAKATDSLARGDLGARAPAGHADELGRLGGGFNVMAERIQSQAIELQDINEALEHTVRERTAELRASEESLATTLNSIGDAVIATDTEGKITRMNPIAEELTGWPLGDARGRRLIDVFRIVNEDSRRPVEDPATKVLREGVVVGLANHTALIARDGRERAIADSGAPIRNPDGMVTGVVLVFRDQTEERRNEDLRVKSHALEIQNRQIQQASRLKSEFLANMSHELRTPLNSVIGFAELLHDGEAGPVLPRQQQFLATILASGKHLLQLINDILDLSKVEAGKLQFQPELVDVAKIVTEVTTILRTITAAKQISLETSVAPELTDVFLDAARLKQVLYNYLSNALKFTPEGGKVVVRAIPEGAMALRVEVEDTGVGIAAEDIPRLFVEFEQLEAGAAKKHGGTGLGLALVKRLIEAQGGTVGARSTVGEGSVFHAVLPRQATGSLPPPAATFVATGRAGARRVLVVEDTASDQAAIVRILEAAGYAVQVARTGSEAIALCGRYEFDAVTLDLILPDMSGLDVLRALRADGRNREIPVVVLTIVTEMATAGFAVHDVLAKPVNGSLLLSSLQGAGLAPNARGRIWVVDDDLGSRELMVTALAQLGFEATAFDRADAALEALHNELPAAVLLDLLMPGIDGFEFLVRFRSAEKNRTIPVLVWSVKDITPDELGRLRASAQAVIQKGAGITDLGATLRAFLIKGGSQGGVHGE